MKWSQQKIILFSFLMLGVIFSLGSYFILYPTIQNILENNDLEPIQKEPFFSNALWDSLSLSWEPWKGKYSHSLFSPDSLVFLASSASLNLHRFQVLTNGNEYRFQVEGGFHSIYSFIQAIEKKAPYWFFEQFELVKSSKPNVYFLKNVCLQRVVLNILKSKNQKIQESEVKEKLKKLISFRERENNRLSSNPFEIKNKVPLPLVKKKPRCHLPFFKIKGAIAGRVLHLQGTGNKTIYKIGDFIGDYRIYKIETKRVLLNCAQDTISRFL